MLIKNTVDKLERLKTKSKTTEEQIENDETSQYGCVIFLSLW